MGEAQHWTLAFRDLALEREFAVSSARAGQRRHRIVWSCVAMLFVIVAIGLEKLVVPTAEIAHIARVGLIGLFMPVYLAIAGLAYADAERFARWRRAAANIGTFVLILGLEAMRLLYPNPERFASSNVELAHVVVSVSVCSLLATRFVDALVAATMFLVMAIAVSLVRFPQVQVVHFTFWYLLAAIVLLLLAWRVEQAERETFLANRRAEQLLQNVLPEAIVERLKKDPSRIADHYDEATVLFADIAGFTPLSQSLPAAEIVAVLDEIFSSFDDIAHRLGLEKIKTIGDAYMVVGGVPAWRSDHVEAVAEMALQMREVVGGRRFAGGHALAMRIGIHTGPVVAGVIGKKKFIYDLWGDTVNTASRMESHGVEGMVQVTAATCERLRDRFTLTPRGAVEVKGKGEMHTWFLEGRKPV